MCFGGGSNNDAKKALEYQKQQAAEAARKERQRQRRLDRGTTTINNLFDGAPVMGEREATYDWSNLKQAMKAYDPYTTVTEKVLNPAYNDRPGHGEHAGGMVPKYIDQTTTTLSKNFQIDEKLIPKGYEAKITYNEQGRPVVRLVDAEGNIYRRGDEIKYMEEYDTGKKTGGFDKAFYNKYRNASLDYYMPELQKQYTKAKSTLNFDHARAGTLQSSMASENVADLVYQNSMNEALLRSKADNATTQLKNSVAAQKSAALAQLYATEDPTVAANTATNSVRTLQNTTPEFSPMGELFKNAVVGASNFGSAYNQYQNWGSPPGSSGTGRVVS
jgi:hypothetical protein